MKVQITFEFDKINFPTLSEIRKQARIERIILEEKKNYYLHFFNDETNDRIKVLVNSKREIMDDIAIYGAYGYSLIKAIDINSGKSINI